ncbi:MAG: PEGA domain-containing protein [Ruminococcus sp.]|nr:PEGA domain-containing protein [Ruminococcus sp.]
MYKRLSAFVTTIMILTLVITGCTSQASNIGLARENDRDTVGTDFVVAEAGSYDSADTAVVISVDPESGSVTFMNIESGRQYTLSYDGTTYVKDKYEGPMSMSQVRAGDIVDITFLKSKKRLASVQISPRSWKFDNIENYDLGGLNKTATIGSNTYSLPDEVVVISEGQRKEVMDVVDKDVLTISGIDHAIYSIEVQKGHGYLRLSNDQALVGGWIEVGNAVIQKITENMLLAVPEGSYQVLLTNGNASCVKDVIIERNKEVILDVGGLEILQDKTGKILISVNPSTASVSIDGELVDISKEVELSYGIHKIRLEAEGYQTMTKYIQVGSEYASINFTMEEGNRADEDESSVSGNSGYDEIIGAVTGNRVYIDGPLNVEVYQDGNYVGVSPVSFTKVTGSHTITLSKTGYVSKSYTIYLYDDGEDITYSFTDLEPEDDTISSSRRNTSSRSTRTTSTSQVTTSSKSTNNTGNDTVSGNAVNKMNVVSVSIAANDPDDLGGVEGVEVYLDDDIYLGICPVKFTKVTGNHKITLSKPGYKSVDKTISIQDDGRDEEYQFKPLEPEDTSGDEEQNKPDNEGKPDDPITPTNPDDDKGDKKDPDDGGNSNNPDGDNSGGNAGDNSGVSGGNNPETGTGGETADTNGTSTGTTQTDGDNINDQTSGETTKQDTQVISTGSSTTQSKAKNQTAP